MLCHIEQGEVNVRFGVDGTLHRSRTVSEDDVRNGADDVWLLFWLAKMDLFTRLVSRDVFAGQDVDITWLTDCRLGRQGHPCVGVARVRAQRRGRPPEAWYPANCCHRSDGSIASSSMTNAAGRPPMHVPVCQRVRVRGWRSI